MRIIVCRKHATTLRNSCFALFVEVLKKFKIYEYCKVRESDMVITLPNDSQILFIGLDDEAKLLSLFNISTIFIEEAFEISRDMFTQLDLRMRGKAPNQQIIMALNPISKNSWIYEYLQNPPANLFYMHSTYLDNPFLNQEYINTLEEMKIRNPKKAKVFVYGEFGTDNDELVFQNWRTEDFNELELASTLEQRDGLDFGWVDPTAFVCTLLDRKNKRIYIYDEFYESGASLDKVADIIERKRQKKVLTFCDSAEPRSIAYLKQRGLAARPAVKGPDSIKGTTAFLQNHEIIVKPTLTHIINELENFKYLKDREGKLTEDTTHEYSHAIDALRYSISDIYKSNKLRSADKAVLNL